MTPTEVVRNIYKSEETLKELQFYMLKNNVYLKLDNNNELKFCKNEKDIIDTDSELIGLIDLQPTQSNALQPMEVVHY